MTVFRTLLAILLTAIVSIVSAQEVRFISAKPSPLRQASMIGPDETTFSGRAKISGLFDVVWVPGNNRDPGYFIVLFRPDRASQAILPHDSARGPVREIWLRNDDVALRAFLTPTQRKSLVTSRLRHATGRATIILGSYRTGVDCDQRGYNAFFVSIVREPVNVVANASPAEQTDGC